MSTRRSRRRVAILAGLVAVGLTVGAGLPDRAGSSLQAQDNWATEAARRIGVRLHETRDASGRAAYPVEPGDVLFYTNVGTSYGAKNTRNSVVVINVRTKKPIAVSDLEPEWSERWTSHGIGVSPDARFVYLPALPPAKASNPGALLVLDARTLKIHQILTTPAGRPHHVKNFTDWTGVPRVLVEDFNWIGAGVFGATTGTGFYVLDFANGNRVVGGMTPGDLRGTPYSGFTAPDGRFLYYSAPGPQFQLAHRLQGWLAKIDMETWRIVQNIPMGTYPLWTVFSQDGQWAWTTNSGDSKVMKLRRASAPGQVDEIVAEVPTGPSPYGLRMNIDDTEVWSADKGETLPGQRGMSITIIDAKADKVKRTLETKCITNDHLILSPDGREMWATCNQSHEVIVLDTKTYEITHRIPMPNQGDSHGGSFVAYTKGAAGLVGETVSDTNGLHGSAREAARSRRPWAPGGS